MTSRPVDVTLHPLRLPPLTVKTQASSAPRALTVAFAVAKRDGLLPDGARIARVAWGDDISTHEAEAFPNAVNRAIIGSGFTWVHDRRTR